MSLSAEILVPSLTEYRSGTSNPAQWLVDWVRGGGPSSSGVYVNADTALKYSAVWAAVNIIAGAVGFLPIHVYRRAGANSGDRTTARDHAVYRLINNRPNPYMSAQNFRETLQGHLLLRGNGYADIQYDRGGRPIALWPLRPDRVKVKINNNQQLGYEVRLPDNTTATLSPDNVFHLAGMGFDGLQGYSVISYAADNIGLGMAAEKNTAAFFANDSSPTGILSTDVELKKETKDRIEKDWEEKHKGLENRHRVAILHSGLKWQAVGISAKDAELVESRKFGVTDVARWFNIPPHMLADLEKATFSNIEHQGQEFVAFTLMRWLKKWESEADYKLFSDAEKKIYFTEFITDALLRGDIKSRYEAYNIGRNAGFLCVDDIRQKENMNSLPDGTGKIFLEPLNMVPAGNNPAVPKQQPAKQEPKKPAELLYQANINLFKSQFNRIIHKQINILQKDVKDNSYRQLKEYAQTVLAESVRLTGCIYFADPGSAMNILYELIEEEIRPGKNLKAEDAERLARTLIERIGGNQNAAE